MNESGKRIDDMRGEPAAPDGAGNGQPAARKPGWDLRKHLPALLFLACLVLYMVLLLVYPPLRNLRPRATGDEPHYLVISRSIVQDWDLSVLDDYQEITLEQSGDCEPGSFAPHVVEGRNGRTVPMHPVFLSLIVLPGFAAFGYAGAAMTMVLFMSLSAMLTFLIIRDVFKNEYAALAITCFFFMTYPLISYSRLIYPEVAVLFLLLLGFWCLMRVRKGSGAGLFLAAGFCAALLPFLHPKFLILTAGVAVFATIKARWRIRPLLCFYAPVLASIALLLLWTYYLYGPNLVSGLTIVSRGTESMGVGAPWGIPGLYLDRVWGLLPYAPLYILFFVGLVVPRSKRELARWYSMVLLVIIMYSVAVGFFRNWDGGSSPVPRYIIPLLPFFVIFASGAILSARKKYVRCIIAVLAALQVVLSFFAVLFPVAAFGIAYSPGNLPLPSDVNQLYVKILGDTWLARVANGIFPLFHPVTAESILLLCCWIVFICALIYLRRYYLSDQQYQMIHGSMEA